MRNKLLMLSTCLILDSTIAHATPGDDDSLPKGTATKQGASSQSSKGGASALPPELAQQVMAAFGDPREAVEAQSRLPAGVVPEDVLLPAWVTKMMAAGYQSGKMRRTYLPGGFHTYVMPAPTSGKMGAPKKPRKQ